MITAQIVTKAFLLFLIASKIIESILDRRNKKHIIANRDQVPDRFADAISLEEHQKAADYSIAKINMSHVFNLVGTVVLLLWTVLGGLEALDYFARGFNKGTIVTGLIFFAAFGILSFFLSLPESIYKTFVLEEKFGFNKTTPKTFIQDAVKGVVLSTVIGLPILAGILWIMDSLGDLWWAYTWAFLTTVQFVLLWAYPTFIAPLFNKFTPLEEGEVKTLIEKLMQKTGFKNNGLFVMDASKRSAHGNAYFTGFGDNKRIVFFDTLIKTLDPREVEAVLAHELGHFKRKHVFKMLVKSIIFSFIGFFILGKLYHFLPFYQGHGVSTPSSYMALCLFMMVSGVYTFFLTPLNALSSRKHEFEADAFAAEHSDAEKLISALVKLYKDNANTLTPDPVYSAYYHSHPPALIRVKHLESLTSSS